MNVAGPRTTTATEIKAGPTNKRQRFGGDLTSEVCFLVRYPERDTDSCRSRSSQQERLQFATHIKKTTKSTKHDTHHQSAVARLDR